MKKLIYLLTAIIVLSLLITGCNKDSNDQDFEHIISEWKTLLYCRGDYGDLVGKYEKNGTTYMFYELDGMDNNNYLISRETSFVNAASGSSVWMNNDAAHPIMIYDVKKIDIKWNNSSKVIEDKQVIDKILTTFRNEKPVPLQDSSSINTVIHFDLPCDLVWDCSIKKEADDSLHIIYFDGKLGRYCSHDVTEALKDILH